MKKLLSLTLAVAMVLSLFAINAGAAVPTRVDDDAFSVSQDYTNVTEFTHASGEPFAYACYNDAALGTDGENTVLDLNGHTLSEAAIEGVKDASEITMSFDAKAPYASSDLRVVLKNNLDSYTLRIRPGVFVELSEQKRADFDSESAIYKGMWMNSATVDDESKLVSDEWYSFTITVDNKSLNQVLTTDSILNAVEIKYKKSADAEYAVLPGTKSETPWAACWTPMVSNVCTKDVCTAAIYNRAETGQQFSVWLFDTEADTITKVGNKAHFLIDNIELSGKIHGENYATNGVIFHEDYENGSNKLNFSGFSKTVTDESGNTYLEIDIPTRVSGVEGVAQSMSSNAITAESLPEGFIWTVDLCKLDANSVDFKMEYFSDSFGTTAEDGASMAKEAGNYAFSGWNWVVGNWYRLKLVKLPGMEKPVGTLKNLTTGETMYTNSAANKEGYLSSVKNYNRFFIRSSLYNDTRVFKWAVDNFTLTELGAESLVYAVKDNGVVSALVNVDAGIDEKATGISVTPILALYKDNRLVSVNSGVVTINDYDGEQKLLTAEGDYDKAVIMLWKSVGDAPVMETWDITSLIRDNDAAVDSEA